MSKRLQFCIGLILFGLLVVGITRQTKASPVGGPAVVGRYQIVSRGGTDSIPSMFLLDTMTGRAWRTVLYTDLHDWAWKPIPLESELLSRDAKGQ